MRCSLLDSRQGFLRENRLASLRVRPASLRAGHLSLLAQRKVTQRKGTPTASPSGHPALRVRERRPGFADDASCIAANARASCARPCGPDRPPSTGAEGDPGERRASCAQSQSRVVGAASAAMLLLLLLRAGARRSSTGVPLRPGERVEDQPEGARARCARVRCGPWMDRQRTPPPDRAVSGQEPADRAAGGVFSLGDFSLDTHCAAGAARTAKLARRAEGRMPGVKKRNRPAGMRDEPTGTWVGLREEPSLRTTKKARAPSPSPLPQAGEGKAT